MDFIDLRKSGKDRRVPLVPQKLQQSAHVLCRLKFPTLEKGAKNTAEGELLSPSERHKEAKKHQTLPEEATPTT